MDIEGEVVMLGDLLSPKATALMKQSRDQLAVIIKEIQAQKRGGALQDGIILLATGEGASDLPDGMLAVIGMLANVGLGTILREQAAQEKAQSN